MTAAVSSPMSTTAGPLLLAVENDPQMRRFLRASLTSHGFALIEADTIEDAVALVADSPCAIAHGLVEVWPLAVSA